ncbi:hypothetical protein CEP54_010802 [Fusarium duplospermum]|uniref:Uncharacterized protein n=1 Tax=Fusarium duplospermum TaxID=1325734 RepID=A0A428PI48_9HYPO|nr:hypothetical protein CEP54_010802 [Fusarium duplospermum]
MLDEFLRGHEQGFRLGLCREEERDYHQGQQVVMKMVTEMALRMVANGLDSEEKDQPSWSNHLESYATRTPSTHQTEVGGIAYDEEEHPAEEQRLHDYVSGNRLGFLAGSQLSFDEGRFSSQPPVNRDSLHYLYIIWPILLRTISDEPSAGELTFFCSSQKKAFFIDYRITSRGGYPSAPPCDCRVNYGCNPPDVANAIVKSRREEDSRASPPER